jgi:hypothetical protein
MIMLLAINVTCYTPHNSVSDTSTLVTPNTLKRFVHRLHWDICILDVCTDIFIVRSLVETSFIGTR